MNTLVTGGAGFIGSHLVERLLESGHAVTVLDNLSTGRLQNLAGVQAHPRLRFVQTDISDAPGIAGHFAGVDWVFHLAALADIVPSIVEPLAYHRANVDGTIAVLEGARRQGVRKLVYAASSSCYGIPERFPTAEDAAILPQYPYAFTKYIGEQYCFSWARVYKLPVVSLRLFNVYGPRSRTSGTYGAVFGVFLAQKLAGAPFTVVGDGTQTRDFVYVTDVAGAFLSAAQSEAENEIFNVGSGSPQSVNTLTKLLGARDVVHIPQRPGEPSCTWADIGKIRSTLGWEPRVSFETGVKKILEQINYWKEAPVWTPEKIEQATRDWFKYLTA